MLKVFYAFLVSLLIMCGFFAGKAHTQTRLDNHYDNVSEANGPEEWSKGLNNTQIVELINLFVEASKFSDEDEKKKEKYAKHIYNLTGVPQFFIGDEMYGFGPSYHTPEKENCMLNIKNSVNIKTNIISMPDVSENCREYIPEMVRKFDYGINN